MSYSKLAVRGTLWSLIQIIVERLTQTVVFLIAAALLGPHQFGIAALATAPAVVMASTLQTGSQLIVRRQAIDEDHLNSIFALFFLGGFFCAALIWVASVFLIGWAISFDVCAMLAVSSIAPIVAAVAVVPEGILARNFSYKILAVRKSVGLLTGGAICCYLALYGWGAWSVVAQVVIAPTVSVVVSIFAAGWRPTAMPDPKSMRREIRFSLAVVGISAVTQINIRFADVLVGLVASPTATGVFRVSRTILDLATSLFLNPVNNILLPIFSRMGDDRNRMITTMWRACGITSLVASIPFVASAFSAPFAAPLFFGEGWPELSEATTLMLLSLPFIAVIVPLQTFLVASGHPAFALRNNVYQTLANVTMIAVGAYFGIFWAAAMFSLRCFLGVLALLFAIQRRFGEIDARDGIKAMSPAILAAVVIAMTGLVSSICGLDLEERRTAMLLTISAVGTYVALSTVIFRERLQSVAKLLTMRRS
jgi:Membrane protein involved in the export of O-antigen and teichoic acid